jgi:hypothetical protein
MQLLRGVIVVLILLCAGETLWLFGPHQGPREIQLAVMHGYECGVRDAEAWANGVRLSSQCDDVREIVERMTRL